MRIYPFAKQVISKHLAVIALLALSAVTATLLSSAPVAWAGPVQNPLQQTIPPMPTPTPPSCGPTEVTGGIIDVNTIWYLACSPYTIKNNVLVDEGVRLTIEPGVVIKFDGFYRIEVAGELIAIGTPTQKITFTSNRTIPQMGDWQAIRFTNTSVSPVVDANDEYVSGNILKYTEISYGGPIQSISGGSAYISHNYIHHVSGPPPSDWPTGAVYGMRYIFDNDSHFV